MPVKKGRTCFVPLCRGGYKSCKEKVSLFRAPSDPQRLHEWARNIKRDDKVLDDSCVVCSRHLEETFHAIEPTKEFVKHMEKLIFVMSSRIPSKGLRSESSSAQFLKDFVVFLSDWEEHAARNGGGFISAGTALGLRVTLQSTLSLPSYVTSRGYRYLLTANLSQNKIENTFGIVRHAYGCNDHPTPEQFLIIINNLSYYSLAKPPKNGNSPAELITALLQPSDSAVQKVARVRTLIDDLLKEGDLTCAEAALEKHCSLPEHQSCMQKKSDCRLIFYIAGYVVRKSLKRFCCIECESSLTILPMQANSNPDASLTKEFDYGGLLYPSKSLETLVKHLGDAFTVFFSSNELEAESMICFLNFLKGHRL